MSSRLIKVATITVLSALAITCLSFFFSSDGYRLYCPETNPMSGASEKGQTPRYQQLHGFPRAYYLNRIPEECRVDTDPDILLKGANNFSYGYGNNGFVQQRELSEPPGVVSSRGVDSGLNSKFFAQDALFWLIASGSVAIIYLIVTWKRHGK